MYFTQGAGGEQYNKQCIMHRELVVSNKINSVLYTGSWW